MGEEFQGLTDLSFIVDVPQMERSMAITYEEDYILIRLQRFQQIHSPATVYQHHILELKKTNVSN